jgi:hypothetical protein
MSIPNTKFEPWIRYLADREKFGRAVLVLEGPTDKAGLTNFRYLQKRCDLADHADEFEWGSGGPGPLQLALAILAEHFQDGGKALRFYERFTWAIVSNLPKDRWIMTSEQISRVIACWDCEPKEAA